MMRTRSATRPMPDARRLVAMADAQSAADAAARIAADAARWASEAGVGEESAWEAACCAMRARHAAEQCERSDSIAAAWSCARLAWAATNSAVEARARLDATIAERLAEL